MLAANTKARNLITMQKALQARTNLLGARLNAMEGRMAARQAIARSQVMRQQSSTIMQPPPAYTFREPTASYPSKHYSTGNSQRPLLSPYATDVSERSLQIIPSARSSTILSRKGSILPSTKFIPATSTPAKQKLYGTNIYDSIASFPGSKVSSITGIPTMESTIRSGRGARIVRALHPPLPALPKTNTRLKRLTNWAKKHKTPLIIAGAGIAVPAAVGGGLQAASETRQDSRDAAMMDATNKQVAAFQTPSTGAFSFGSGGGGGGGGMANVRKWLPPAVHAVRKKIRRRRQSKKLHPPRKQKKKVTNAGRRKLAPNKQRNVGSNVKLCITKRLANGGGKISKCIKKRMGKSAALEYKKLKSGVTAAYVRRGKLSKIKHKQLPSKVTAAYPAF